MSLATVTNIETGRTSLTVQHLYRLAAAFGVAPAALLADDPPPALPESELVDAVRRHDRGAALAALARALGLPLGELTPLPNPSSPTYTPANVADLGRNAARLARSAARLLSDAEGADPARLLAEWTDEEA